MVVQPDGRHGTPSGRTLAHPEASLRAPQCLQLAADAQLPCASRRPQADDRTRATKSFVCFPSESEVVSNRLVVLLVLGSSTVLFDLSSSIAFFILAPAEPCERPVSCSRA